jgi:hypothetical protein
LRSSQGFRAGAVSVVWAKPQVLTKSRAAATVHVFMMISSLSSAV